jgi:Fe2+ or Zn2+ uptake regulation protein
MDKANLEFVKRKLRSEGFKLTMPRLAIIEYLISVSSHPDVQQIYDGMRTEHPGIGIATIYRTVDLLERIGLLRTLKLESGHLRYEIIRPGDHHHHLVCTGCGQVSEFGDCNFQMITEAIEKKTRFKIRGHNLEAYGLCSRCYALTG